MITRFDALKFHTELVQAQIDIDTQDIPISGGVETTEAQYRIREGLTKVKEPESTLEWEVV